MCLLFIHINEANKIKFKPKIFIKFRGETSVIIIDTEFFFFFFFFFFFVCVLFSSTIALSFFHHVIAFVGLSAGTLLVCLI